MPKPSGSHGGAVHPSASVPPLRPTEDPLAPTPPAKHTTFLREQTSDRQAHGQAHRQETGGRRKLVSQSHRICERPGPEERTGGRVSGETEAEREEGSETDSKTARGRYRQTDRRTCTRAHVCAHTHTHTHREAETERGRHRASDRETANGRQTGERGWHRIRDRHTGTACDAPQREARGRSSFPKGGGVSLGPAPAGHGALGLAVTRGDPKTSSKPRSQRSPSAWLPKVRPSPRSQARG